MVAKKAMKCTLIIKLFLIFNLNFTLKILGRSKNNRKGDGGLSI
jgi:hypothetical protein